MVKPGFYFQFCKQMSWVVALRIKITDTCLGNQSLMVAKRFTESSKCVSRMLPIYSNNLLGNGLASGSAETLQSEYAVDVAFSITYWYLWWNHAMLAWSRAPGTRLAHSSKHAVQWCSKFLRRLCESGAISKAYVVYTDWWLQLFGGRTTLSPTALGEVNVVPHPHPTPTPPPRKSAYNGGKQGGYLTIQTSIAPIVRQTL